MELSHCHLTVNSFVGVLSERRVGENDDLAHFGEITPDIMSYVAGHLNSQEVFVNFSPDTQINGIVFLANPDAGKWSQ